MFYCPSEWLRPVCCWQKKTKSLSVFGFLFAKRDKCVRRLMLYRLSVASRGTRTRLIDCKYRGAKPTNILYHRSGVNTLCSHNFRTSIFSKCHQIQRSRSRKVSQKAPRNQEGPGGKLYKRGSPPIWVRERIGRLPQKRELPSNLGRT